MLRKAVIGIGSNSMRLLVAEMTDGRFVCVCRGRRDVRPFAGLEQGRFTQETLDVLVRTARDMRREALALGSAEIALIATSATREAGNAQTLAQRLQREAGLVLRVLTGEEEACLSFVGGARPGYCGLADIGGGSTELTVGTNGRPQACVSLELGAVRLQRTRPFQGAGEALALVGEIAREIRAGWNGLGQPLPQTWVAVGGTATTLAAMDRGASGPVEGHLLKKAAVEALLASVSEMRVEAIARLPGISARRADIIAPGAAIVLACMEALEMDGLIVSERGNLDGCLMEMFAAV